MSTIPQPRACHLLRSAAEPAERFEGVAALARRIHDLCGGKPIYLKRGVVTGSAPAGEMVIVRLAEEAAGDAAVAYVLVGEPPLPGAVQYDRLAAALTPLFPGAEAA